MLSSSAAPSAATFPLAPSTSSSTTSSARKRLSGLINLRSYTSNSVSSTRDPSTSRNQNNRHSIHGAIFRSSANRANSTSRSRSRARASTEYDSSLAAALSAVAFDPAEYLAEPISITLDTQLVEPLPGSEAPPASPVTSHRFSTRFCESAAEALLLERTSQNSSPELGSADGEMTRSRSATSSNDMAPDALPSIRLSAFYDPRSTRPSLSFTPITRTLPTGTELIKVGRYSERESQAPVPANVPSSAPVGFKSKVVSRRHCEFWFEKSKWYVKDVKSSSGTFLNHIRLSAPGTESKPYPINDGDMVQLGIDFKGGEEMIYRCVKMRVELNRGWQLKPNTFNMATHKRLRDITAGASNGAAGSHAQDCSICLNAIAPCQSLFVAPCSHTWHFKCIREMLHGPSWPLFMCPNCRATADLDAEVDEPVEDWQQLPEDVPEEKAEDGADGASGDSVPDMTSLELRDTSPSGDRADATILLNGHAASSPVAIPAGNQRRTPSPDDSREGPITPRNDAGPWVFDGNPGRVSQESTRRGAMRSLDAAAQQPHAM
ncbi:hypothetical protein F5Y18DRAFT_229262 [Xylariaceae sp. FL1019]|nr:hypothetical protein F5Y18DRAFT_229262 [Xylariaceae sp. FL1019]